jgi:hypothetical protein
MATMQSFKRYVWGESGTSLLERAVDWDGAPVHGLEVVRATGLDVDDELVAVGVLTTPWNGHPVGAVVVSELMVTGVPFAVGNEGAGHP